MSIGNKYTYQTMHFKSNHPKRKTAPTCVHMTNSAAEVVLRERKVEIKDLESQVNYLQNQIKVLKIENKTLREVQTRHEKELRKFKEGVADIPFLLRSHKDEIKAMESNTLSLRRELRDCQKELKIRCDTILRKDQLVEKLSASSKRQEKQLQEFTAENKELKTEKKKLDEESKKLIIANEETKFKNERFQKKIQQMTNKILNLEESLGSAEHHEIQLKEDMMKLQKSYDELKQNLATSESQVLFFTKEIQTDLSYINEPKSSKYLERSSQSDINKLEHLTPEDNVIILDTYSKESINEHEKNCDINSFGDCFKSLMRMERKIRKKKLQGPPPLPVRHIQHLRSCKKVLNPYLIANDSEIISMMENCNISKATQESGGTTKATQESGDDGKKSGDRKL